MVFAPVIRSLLDTDLYKFTMWQPFLHRLPANQARYRFVCRNRPAYPLASLKHEVEAQIEHLCGLRFTEEELACLSSKRYLKSDFIDYLRIFHFQHRYIDISADGDDLLITAQGPQIHVMGFEIFVLAIVNELYFRRSETPEVLSEARRRLQAKIKLLDGIDDSKRHAFSFFDFGTRRRFSLQWHREVISTLHAAAPHRFKGTSNVYLAKELGLTAIGTMAHEYLQTFQAVGVQLRHFQKAALESWVQEYRGDLGVALTDVVGMDAFLADFDLYFSKLFDGLRHDSGDPIEWGEKALRHYESQRIDPHTKRLVFSDGLDLPRAIELHSHFADRVGCGFGIGTNLTNDTGLEPLNIVMKLTECNGQPVAKISDSPGKTLCSDETFLAYLRQVFGIA
ncbi:MAG TPA: nicotinate phosphoribosyltransferase [Povalibacter sp.]